MTETTSKTARRKPPRYDVYPNPTLKRKWDAFWKADGGKNSELISRAMQFYLDAKGK